MKEKKTKTKTSTREVSHCNTLRKLKTPVIALTTRSLEAEIFCIVLIFVPLPTNFLLNEIVWKW